MGATLWDDEALRQAGVAFSARTVLVHVASPLGGRRRRSYFQLRRGLQSRPLRKALCWEAGLLKNSSGYLRTIACRVHQHITPTPNGLDEVLATRSIGELRSLQIPAIAA
jgi:hypothetical protein